MARKLPKVYAFFDTNVFLEYKEFRELDWTEILGAETVCIVLAPTVIDELDDRKTDPRSARRQKRARSMSSLLGELLLSEDAVSGQEVDVPQRPEVTILAPFGTPDPAAHGLSTSRQDHHIVASVLDFKKGRRDLEPRQVLVVSGDVNLLQTAKAREIHFHRLSDEHLWEPEPSPEQKENAKLKAENARFKNREPAIEVFPVGLMGDVLAVAPDVSLDGQLEPLKDKVLQKLGELERFERRAEQRESVEPIRIDGFPELTMIVNPLRAKYDLPESFAEELMRYLSAAGVPFRASSLRPRDLFTEPDFSPGSPGIKNRVVGPDGDWYSAVYRLKEEAEKYLRLRHNAGRVREYRKLRVNVKNSGGGAAEGLEVILRSRDGSAIFASSLDLWSQDAGIHWRYYAQYPNEKLPWRLGGFYPCSQLEVDVGLLKPGEERGDLSLGYVRVPKQGQTSEVVVEAMGTNLPKRAVGRFLVRAPGATGQAHSVAAPPGR